MHAGASPGDWQGEVAQAAEEIGNRLAGPRVEQADGATHQHRIDVAVHLGEVGRQKTDRHIEFGHSVRQCGRILGVKERCSLGPLGLQPDLYAVLIGKRAQMVFVLGGEHLQHPKYQYRHRPADRHLDLRHAVWTRQRLDKMPHRHKHRGEGLGQHTALAHVDHITGAVLVKPDQYTALLRHVAY